MMSSAGPDDPDELPTGLVPGGSSGPGKKKTQTSESSSVQTPIGSGSDPLQHSQLKFPVPTPEPMQPIRTCNMGTCTRDAVTTCAECHMEVCTVHFFSTGKRFFCTSCYKDEYSIADQQVDTDQQADTDSAGTGNFQNEFGNKGKTTRSHMNIACSHCSTPCNVGDSLTCPQECHGRFCSQSCLTSHYPKCPHNHYCKRPDVPSSSSENVWKEFGNRGSVICAGCATPTNANLCWYCPYSCPLRFCSAGCVHVHAQTCPHRFDEVEVSGTVSSAGPDQSQEQESVQVKKSGPSRGEAFEPMPSPRIERGPPAPWHMRYEGPGCPPLEQLYDMIEEDDPHMWPERRPSYQPPKRTQPRTESDEAREERTDDPSGQPSMLLAGGPTGTYTQTQAQEISQETDIQQVNRYRPETYDDPETKLSVNSVFPLSEECTYEILHSVRGSEMIGLLIDPGASKGLIGMDTVGDIQQWILEPANKLKEVFWYPSNAGFSGISASVEKAVSLVQFPIGLAGMRGTTFRADVIGGAASRCPGLLPLQSLIQAATVAVFGCFPNGDGIFAFKDGATGQLCPQRVYRTDSGHYLLDISQFNKPVKHDLVNFLSTHFQYKLMKSVSSKKGSKGSGPPTRPPGQFSKGSGSTFLITHLGDFPPEAQAQTSFQATAFGEGQDEDSVFQ